MESKHLKKHKNVDEEIEQKERGIRIKNIRLELKMNKTKFAQAIGISAQFLGLVEEGKGNIVYKSIKKMKEISGYSADYILFGLDDNIINKTKLMLENYTDKQIIQGFKLIEEMACFIKNTIV